METDFKAGDIVKLKTGGPDMNVERTIQTNEGPKVCCRWFVGSKPHEGRFSVTDVERVPKQ